MKLLFAGTPDIAAVVLQSLIDNPQHEVVAVLTQPDRPSGRGQKLMSSPVKVLAEAHQLPVLQPLKLKEAEVQAKLNAYEADLMIVVAYGLIVPEAVLKIPKLGCWNVHVSLLPRWRGAAPIQRAIEAGDATSGVTLIQMDTGLDTGPILLQAEYVIDKEITAGQLHDALAKEGAELLRQGLELQAQGKLRSIPQPELGATYAHKLTKEEASINWQLSAVELADKVRAFNPFPICRTAYQDQVIRIWKARAAPANSKVADAKPGQIVDIGPDRLSVMTGAGVLELFEIQMPGGKVMDMSIFLNGHKNFFQLEHVFS